MNFHDTEGLKSLAKLAGSRLPDADFPSTLNKYGTPGVVGFQAESGNFATHNYSRGFHEDYKKNRKVPRITPGITMRAHVGENRQGENAHPGTDQC